MYFYCRSATSAAITSAGCKPKHQTTYGLRRYSMRWIMCTPDSVSMMPEISATSSAKAASSNGFCMRPRPNTPRSPPFRAEEQSLSVRASSSNDTSPETMRSRYADSMASASSLLRVICGDFHEDGRRDSVCFTSRWRHCTRDIVLWGGGTARCELVTRAEKRVEGLRWGRVVVRQCAASAEIDSAGFTETRILLFCCGIDKEMKRLSTRCCRGLRVRILFNNIILCYRWTQSFYTTASTQLCTVHNCVYAIDLHNTVVYITVCTQSFYIVCHSTCYSTVVVLEEGKASRPRVLVLNLSQCHVSRTVCAAQCITPNTAAR